MNSFDNQQQQDQRHQEEMQHLKDSLWLNQEVLKIPDALERTLKKAEKLGLKQDFEQYLSEVAK